MDDDDFDDDASSEEETVECSPHVHTVTSALLARFRAVADKRIHDAAALVVRLVKRRRDREGKKVE
jgi:hypothetical protein